MAEQEEMCVSFMNEVAFLENEKRAGEMRVLHFHASPIHQKRWEEAEAFRAHPPHS